MTLTTTIKDGNNYEQTLIKYHEEKEKSKELLSELTRTLEDMRFLSSENRYLREKHKNDMERYKNLDKGIEVDHMGQLWILVEEFYYDHNELEQYPSDQEYVQTLRCLYDERECGKFYQMMTRGDIRKLIRKENADEYTPYV
jgi:citrate synthase